MPNGDHYGHDDQPLWEQVRDHCSYLEKQLSEEREKNGKLQALIGRMQGRIDYLEEQVRGSRPGM
jgi:hypothetical protein